MIATTTLSDLAQLVRGLDRIVVSVLAERRLPDA